MHTENKINSIEEDVEKKTSLKTAKQTHQSL
jgi:hypothetical protein